LQKFSTFYLLQSIKSFKKMGLVHLCGQNFGQARGPGCCDFRRIHGQGAIDKEKSAADGRLAAGRKLTEKVNVAKKWGMK
jgi:hypothetical protein